MTRHSLKTSGIIRSGFEYQDLIGIEVLLRFYRDPHLFRWIELESEDKTVGKLDDVVAARSDGGFEVLQVKFTPDPDTYLLDWTWLLAKKTRGTSLLVKWSAGLAKIKGLGPVHSAKLRTNRRPDPVFATSLDGNFVDFDRIPPAIQTSVVAEVGGTAAARAFFAEFEFAHSEPLFDELESRLKGEIVPTDTDNAGWLLLRDAARRWAINKKSPEPDGRIRHEHLVQNITKGRPKPIPQDFKVPALYRPPSERFNDDLLSRIRTGSRSTTVLWGTPGRGKSTYLSYLAEVLRKAELPAIRHHYFLSLDDSTADRISFVDIAASLIDQMASYHAEAVRGLEPTENDLRNWIQACGAHYEKEGKRFYVVVDGLDHVWRERQNISQMEHLFNRLLPCPSNVVLILGTQRVAKEQLPQKLLTTTTEEDWVEVPPMDEGAVLFWLEGQERAGRLLLREGPSDSGPAELSAVSSAFYDISNGNPLHLIYSFEALVRRGAVVTEDVVRALPPCPDGDIRKYYGSLWGKLPASAKRVLHLVAGSNFHWPEDGLRRCAGDLYQVDHLLEHRRTGVIPFHGSITAYAQEQQEHRGTFLAVLPNVVRWLATEAPEYWRWAWLWIMRARAGKPNDLLTKTSRRWVIESLAKGWPSNQIVTILSEAERVAFNLGDYSRTIELRSLKVRVLNGPDHQVGRYDDFQESAIRLAGNDQQVLNMADVVDGLDDGEIALLARCLAGQEVDGIGQDCYEALRKKVNLAIVQNHRNHHEFVALVERFLEALVDFGDPDIDRLLRFIDQFETRDQFFTHLLSQVMRRRNFEMAIEVLAALDDDRFLQWRARTQEVLIRIAGIEGIDLGTRLSRPAAISPLLACWYRVKGLPQPGRCIMDDVSPAALRDARDYGSNPSLEGFFHSFFFISLSIAFDAQGVFCPILPGLGRSQSGWLQTGMDALSAHAFEIAREGHLDFGSIFLSLADLEPVEWSKANETSATHYRAFQVAVRRIAKDLHFIRCAAHGPSLVSRDSFDLARASTHWIDEMWVTDELKTQTLIFEASSVQDLVHDMEKSEAGQVTRFSERAEKWIDLAKLSVVYGLDAHRFVIRAADCIVGFGWHKDVSMFDVLSAIEALHDSSSADVVPMLRKLAPIIDQITEFTDGDETRYVPDEFIDLIAKAVPGWLPRLHAHYIAKEEWSLADKVLTQFMRHVDFATPAGRALGRSLVDRAHLETLEAIGKGGSQAAKKVLADRRRFLGVSGVLRRTAKADKSKNKDELGRKGRPPDVKKYAPSELEALLERVRRPSLGYLHGRDALRRWIEYWDSEGKGLAVLRSIDGYFTSHENPHEVEPLLDDAFRLSLKYEGKTKAYKWLVRAQIERHGWDYYYERSEIVESRLRLAAEHYGSRWADFIGDTSKPARFWENRRPGLILGTRRLVQFFLLVRQPDQAVRFTEAMVNLTQAEVEDQPIPSLEWLP